MAFETISPNMNLPLPGVSLTDGPQWASDLNASLTIIDGHDHASGSGVQINPAGLNINSDLAYNVNNATLLRSVRFSSQGSPLVLPADLGCLYESGVDLYYNDGAGNQVRITQSGGVAGSPGSISNLTSPASAAYVALNGTFVWEQAANTSADMDFGSAIMRNDTANSHALTLSPPAAMGSDFSLVLPSLPGSTLFMTLDASGNMGTASNVQGTQLAAGTLTGSQLANATVTKDKLAPLGQQISASCGTTSISSTSYTSVTNLTVTITTSGRPVFVGLVPDGSGDSTRSEILSPISGTGLKWRIFDSGNSIEVANGQMFNSGGQNTAGQPYAFSTIYVPSAGTYTYVFQIAAFTTGSQQVLFCKMISYEL